MADDLYYKHGTSDEYNDPFCDVCFETKGLNVKVFGYCKECFQFLCTECQVFHKHFQGTKDHIVLRGADMPQSQAEKPPRFHFCDAHSKEVKDLFCSSHSTLLCSLCAFSEHKDCSFESIEDTCKNIDGSQISGLYDIINSLKLELVETESSVGTNLETLREEKAKMLKEARDIYDKIIAKANELFEDLKGNIEAKHQSQLTILLQNQRRINDVVARLDTALDEINKLKGQTIDTKVFLKMQDVVSSARKICNDAQDLNEKNCSVSMSFEPSKESNAFVASSKALGSVSVMESKSDTALIISDITFPVIAKHSAQSMPLVTRQQPAGASGVAGKAKPTEPPISLSEIKVTEKESYNVSLSTDMDFCHIVGVAITTDNSKICMDSRLKMLSPDMQPTSTCSLPSRPLGISFNTDSEIIISMDNKTLAIVDICNKQMRIKSSHKIPFKVGSIERYKDKYIVTCEDTDPGSIKLIDLSGKVYWSLSQDQQGDSLFGSRQYLSTFQDESSSSSLVVTDINRNAIFLVNGETGEVMTKRQLKNEGPCGVTTDKDGNIYVCYLRTHEVAVFNRDLSENRILLSQNDHLGVYPQDIVYDAKAHQLIVSYYFGPHLDCFQLQK